MAEDPGDLVTIASRDLTVRINPLGAELWSITDRAGGEWMTDADPAFWTGRAPVLFPIVGALRDGQYRLDGRSFPLPKHGFARTSRFPLVEHRAGFARFRLTDTAETRQIYPFAFELELAFRIDGFRLETEARIANRGDEAMPFSFGFHPAFAWPLPGGGDKLAHTIEFERDEPQDIARIDGAGLVDRHEASPVRGNRLLLSPDLFADDALIWDRLASRRMTYRGPDGAAIEVSFPDTPFLGVWQKPGANYICIEPWQGLADFAGFAGDLPEKPGVVLLAPGRTHSMLMDLTVIPR